MLSFFKKTKVENSTDFEGMSVTLPKSKVEKTITQLVNEMDHMMEKEKSPQMANGDHKAKVGEEEMTVNELIEKYTSKCNEYDELKKQHEGADSPEEIAAKKAAETPAKTNMDQLQPEVKKENEDKPVEEKKENEDVEEKDGKKKNAHFEALKNAPSTVIRDPVRADLDKAARGKAHYGSN